jgi:hypothetical protein
MRPRTKHINGRMHKCSFIGQACDRSDRHFWSVRRYWYQPLTKDLFTQLREEIMGWWSCTSNSKWGSVGLSVHRHRMTFIYRWPQDIQVWVIYNVASDRC